METTLHDRDRVGVQDAVLLDNVTDPVLFVDNLDKRFNANLIYTNIGSVLVSVNPYKEIDIYGPEAIKEYQTKNIFETSPHIYALSDTAYRSLKEENREQCILISGESGSGKTEASKKVLQYIAQVTERKGKVETVKSKLLQSNDILEAFGNARTNRNDNSSRFGKYMDIEFDFEGIPIGGNILNYLLEKSRVINQVTGERNFHIFYQLLHGGSDEELTKLYLKKDLNTYYYLSNGDNHNSSSHNDKTLYNSTNKALSILEFTDVEKSDIFKIIASILHLGNIGFTENEGEAKVNKLDPLENICKLLLCEPEDLKKALTHRTREAKGDVVTSPLNRETAVYARDALAKAVYDRLFTWLVTRINQSLQPETRRNQKVIGILDIYGFEIFQKNNFEQLCINFCNEKLQQLFIELTLKSEQEEYFKEGIEWQNVEYFDNKVICDLIEEKHKGIIALMDEECLRPGDATDLTLLAKMNKHLSNHPHYKSHPKADTKLQKEMGRDEFQLIHYAGAVTYNVRNFLEKNNDLLFRDLKEVMLKSENSIINVVFTTKEQESKKRPDTAINQFKNSLNALMKILMNKEPNYIRCIKPNDNKTPEHFDHKLVSHQVTYLGLMENLRVRRAGFAYRRLYEQFLGRYKSLCKQTWPHYEGDPKQGVQILINQLGYAEEEYRMGRTKIFIRFPKTLFQTEDAFQAKKNDLAAIIQSRFKGYIQRKKYLQLKKTSVIIQKWIRRWQAKRTARRKREAVETIRKFIKGFITRNGPKDDINKSFIELAKRQWLVRLSKSLPKHILDKSWPPCPYTCKEASEILRHHYRLLQGFVYRKNLSTERKTQFELKLLSERLFFVNAQKKSYNVTITQWFKNERIPTETEAVYTSFVNSLAGEQVKYATMAVKYDRHGYKPRNRLIIATNTHLYILEVKGSSTIQKHKLSINDFNLLVTTENDRMLMLQLPNELIKKDKGDIILEVPHLIECVTKIIAVTKKETSLKVVDSKTIEHNMIGKQGIIDIKIGKPESIQKDKTGHLLITASP